MFSSSLIPHLCLTLIFFIPLSGNPVAVNAATQIKNSGELKPTGQVRINGNTATFNTTIISGSTVNTGERSEAVIHLNKIGKIKLHPFTQINFNFSQNAINISLEAGKITLIISKNVAAQVKTKTGWINADDKEPSRFTVEAEHSAARVEVTAGEVTLTAEKKGSRILQTTKLASNAQDQEYKPTEANPEDRNAKVKSLIRFVGLLIEAGVAVETALRFGATGKITHVSTDCNTIDVGPNK